MEFEVLDERVEREARRVAAAFGVKEWSVSNAKPVTGVMFAGQHLIWVIHASTAELLGIRLLGPRGEQATICDKSWAALPSLRGVKWTCHFHPAVNELMARGLYRLGVEHEEVLAEINHPLSAHEKMELRLSMPREFWPQQWIDEENGGVGE